MKIVAVGDIMPGGVLHGRDGEFLSAEVKAILESGDIRIGTLETAIGNDPSFYAEKMKRKADVIYAKDEDMNRLVEMNINIVSLANNHFFDLGPEGAKHTIQLLDHLGIQHCGAGNTLAEASAPAVVSKDGHSYAFLAFCDWRDETTGWCPFAAYDSPGINPMYEDHVISSIRTCKERFDYVIVIPHWGVEYCVRPSSNVYKLANKMLKAGADLILGGHTHCVQPVIQKKHGTIVFSMGNFLFPDRLICPPRSTFYPDTPIDISTLPQTECYPYVKEVTLKKWKEIARYGLITSICLGNGTTSTTEQYVHMMENNVLEVSLLQKKVFKSLKISKKAMQLGVYRPFSFICRGISHYSRIFRNFF